MDDLKDKIAVITGSARGIGKSIAINLMNSGAKIVISDINETALSDTVKELTAMGGQVMGVQCNVTLNDDIDRLVKEVTDKWERIDILVNNAGITRDNLMMRMTDTEWQAVIDTNLTSAFKMTKAITKVMSKQKFGRIINIASTTGVHGNFGQANYAAAKAGLIGLTKTTALEFASRNITCNAVAPGFIDTDMTRALSNEIITKVLEKIPMKKMGSPEDIANAVKFFASSLSHYITGTVLEVNGGLYT